MIREIDVLARMPSPLPGTLTLVDAVICWLAFAAIVGAQWLA